MYVFTVALFEQMKSIRIKTSLKKDKMQNIILISSKIGILFLLNMLVLLCGLKKMGKMEGTNIVRQEIKFLIKISQYSFRFYTPSIKKKVLNCVLFVLNPLILTIGTVILCYIIIIQNIHKYLQF